VTISMDDDNLILLMSGQLNPQQVRTMICMEVVQHREKCNLCASRRTVFLCRVGTIIQ